MGGNHNFLLVLVRVFGLTDLYNTVVAGHQSRSLKMSPPTSWHFFKVNHPPLQFHNAAEPSNKMLAIFYSLLMLSMGRKYRKYTFQICCCMHLA